MTAIYANGIIESDQAERFENINIYPEVSGPVTKVLVHEGQEVSAGTPLLTPSTIRCRRRPPRSCGCRRRPRWRC
jgi:acetyl/propionyl-CoA carboxylase alpha subunit